MRTIIALLACMLGIYVSAQEDRPNVIVMIVDDLGYGDVSCLSNGKIKTPNLDRLAKSGVTFTAGYSTASLCAPSRAGFYTGQYQQRFGFFDNEGSIPVDAKTLPGILRQGGYRTGLIGKWHSGGPLPHARGWWDETFCSPRPSPFITYQNPVMARNGKLEQTTGYSTDLFAKEATSFIERNKAKPFNLTIAFNAPHIDRVVTPHHIIREKFEAAQAKGEVYDVPKFSMARPGESAKYASLFPGDTARADTAACINALDEAVGRILDSVEQSGLTKKTMIFFFADNGAHPENRSENGILRDYKWTHFEGGMRVPFLATYPGVFPAGLTYKKPVSSFDILPTALAAASITPPEKVDGVNLTPYLKGEKTTEPHEILYFRTTAHSAVRQGKWKLVVQANTRPLLFDLEADASEKKDLFEKHPDIANELLAKWTAWNEQFPKRELQKKKQPAQQANAELRPNVLFLFSDQHHAEAMGCAGHTIVKTPSLDALAKRGLRFTRAYSQDAICTPSRISLMTGLYPRTIGILTNGDEDHILDARNYYPLQQAFQAAGYFTAVSGKIHLGKKQIVQGWDRGATSLPLKMDPVQESYFDWIREKGHEAAFKRDWDGTLNADLGAHLSDLPPEYRDAPYTADRATGYIREAVKAGKPFFCWATFHGPHQPYTPPKKWADLYPVESIPLPANWNEPIANLPPAMQNLRRNEKTPWNCAKAAREPELYKRMIAYYYAQITEVDHSIGEIVKCLDELGVRENTIIVYSSDHGDFMGRHGMVEKNSVGHNVYEDTLRVPLIISWPGRGHQDMTCDNLVELVDLYPTLCEVTGLGLRRPPNTWPLAGKSLVPLLKAGLSNNRKYAFSENWSQSTIIGLRYKLGVWTDPLPAYQKWNWLAKGAKDQLYDLKNDPLEVNNLIGTPEVAAIEKELRDALTEWKAGNGEAEMQRISDAISARQAKPKKKQ